MTGPAAGSGGRDSLEIEALLTDRYLDALLATRDTGARGPSASAVPPARRASPEPDPAPSGFDASTRGSIDRLAQALARDLVRVHPSFRFEERLAARLSAAASNADGLRADRDVVITFPRARRSRRTDRRRTRAGSPLPPVLIGAASPAGLGAPRPRPMLLGGAVASALSLAGAAFVAWRRVRSPAAGDPWTRAIRAAHPVVGRAPFRVGGVAGARPRRRAH